MTSFTGKFASACWMSVALVLPAFSAMAQAPAAKPDPIAPAVVGPYAACEDGRQDREACRREIASTRNLPASALTEDGSDDAAVLRNNALRRCAVHAEKSQARAECEDRILGIDNTQVQGEALDGGVLRRQTIRAPAQ